jgi:hypothetical protein
LDPDPRAELGRRRSKRYLQPVERQRSGGRPWSRPVYAALTAVTIVLGLLSRRISELPSWLAKDAGDALYATMVFWLLGLLAPALPSRRAAVAAVTFCFAVELGQLYHAPWIDAIRDTRLGGLVLGHGFHASDLICYAVGVLLGVLIERPGRRD